MSSGFNRNEVAALLARCHRRCCICHRFCGVKMETDHIEQRADGGDNSIANAIPVCFECHAEIHSYNPNHPRGRRFTPQELKAHKEQWLEICADNPEALVSASRSTDVGPIQALVDELDFNLVVADQPNDSEPGCLFMDEHFRRAMSQGVVSVMHDDLKEALLHAYVKMGKVNELFNTVHRAPIGTNLWNPTPAYQAATAASEAIRMARERLLEYIGA